MLRTSLRTLLLVQVVIATWQLTQPRPARFGWQMYAGVSQPTAFTAIYPTHEEPVPLARYVARVRADVDLARAIPPAVCARNLDVVAVRYRIIPERTARQVTCRR